jgi:hypothetical protein
MCERGGDIPSGLDLGVCVSGGGGGAGGEVGGGAGGDKTTTSSDTSGSERSESFTLCVNGRPLFCKGADWIPSDIFECRTTAARLRSLLGSAAAVGMNCVRVWGGGMYEQVPEQLAAHGIELDALSRLRPLFTA